MYRMRPKTGKVRRSGLKQLKSASTTPIYNLPQPTLSAQEGKSAAAGAPHQRALATHNKQRTTNSI